MRILILTAALAFAADPNVKVVRQTTPEKALVFEVTVAAPKHKVWEAFATSEGLGAWLAPNATVELKTAGEWIVRNPDGKTAGGTILSFVSGKEMTIAAMAPEQFPTVRAQRTNARFEFIEQGDDTLVRLTQTGWKSGDEWDRAYDYLASGNAQLLDMLRQRFARTAK
jgi:uncharacterized protein YndB with AHSA1/START domain